MAWLIRMFVVVAMFLVVVGVVTDQAAVQDCATKLTPCLSFLNDTTTPTPDTCCTPVKDAITNEKTCLCNYYNTPGLLESAGVDIARVLKLIHSCKVDADPAVVCKGSTSSPNNTSTVPPPSKSNAVAGRIVGVGALSLILLLVSSMLY